MAEPEHRYTLGVVYGARELDAHKDWAGASDIETAAWHYVSGDARVGLHHRPGTEGAGVVVESYVHRGPRWVVRDVAGEQQVVEPGDWLLGVVWSPEAWSEIRSGQATGYSLQGWAQKAIECAARERKGGRDMPLFGMNRSRDADGGGRQQELSPAIREAIDAAIREALRQALPQLVEELESRFRTDVAELRRSLDGHREALHKSAPGGPPRPPNIINWGGWREARR